MKIGIISDIHGNIHALDTVLKELKSKKIEKIIYDFLKHDILYKNINKNKW